MERWCPPKPSESIHDKQGRSSPDGPSGGRGDDVSTMTSMPFATGSLVRARGREWVVLPESDDTMLVLRPLGGSDEEIAGIYLPLEPVESARFELPDPEHPGDHNSCRLLRDALRLGFRSSAGPFRSFARIAVEPRPYQLVPLLLALKLDPVRLLIADDVGIGKTVEAALIARELLDRGEISRLCVLCPPHLAEQWQSELASKFHIDAHLVLPGTVRRLERDCALGESLFERYDCLIVSIDFIKSDRRRDDFLRACPEFVIVDEAHTCAYAGEGGAGRHQRHQLLKGLTARSDRHIVLVTATPHSGNEAAFRSLLSLLRPDFEGLPEELSGRENEAARRELARHFVQRRRGDIRHFMQADTPFPERLASESTYRLSEPYRRLFDRVLAYAREAVADPDGDRRVRRVRWWSALALLRALASSPAAAEATLRSRAATVDAESAEEIDDIGRRTVLDPLDEEGNEGIDAVPGGDIGGDGEESERRRRRLLDMARAARDLFGDHDAKLHEAVKIVRSLLDEGHRPILFCRFIHTAEYVAAALRSHLSGGVTVAAVTGSLPPAAREEAVLALAASPERVLVCTDCLSEGINLQEGFDAVIHYDLSWNPTRHEQREGRVDRYGQSRHDVKIVMYWGLDNQIDGIVLDVLLRKHQAIRASTGISVPVPARTDEVIEAIFEGLLLRRSKHHDDEQMPLFDEEWVRPKQSKLYAEWEASADRERRSRTMFAQESIKVDEVARELAEVRGSIGSGDDVRRFTLGAVHALRGVVGRPDEEAVEFDLSETPEALRDMIGVDHRRFTARFEPPVAEGELLLTRTHPVVAGLAGYIVDTALDGRPDAVARRCGAIRTSAVERRTTLLLLRFRYHITRRSGEISRQMLAEECRLVAFEGAPASARWLDDVRAEELTAAVPAQNMSVETKREFLRKALDGYDRDLLPHLETVASERARELLESHRRVRAASGTRGVSYEVRAQLPVDLLGVFILLPA